MTDPFKYATIAAPVEADFRDRGSKFLAYAFPVNSANDVKEQLQLLKKEHPKAVHHCYAYRLGTDGNSFRANDDGEPAGSAGKPILGQIDSAGLTNVLVVVVRYFGGTLLGIPGLINAYKTVTADALKQANIIEREIEKDIEVSFDYPGMNEVLHILKQHHCTIHQQELQLFCRIAAGVPIRSADVCLEQLNKIRGVGVKQMTHAQN